MKITNTGTRRKYTQVNMAGLGLFTCRISIWITCCFCLIAGSSDSTILTSSIAPSIQNDVSSVPSTTSYLGDNSDQLVPTETLGTMLSTMAPNTTSSTVNVTHSCTYPFATSENTVILTSEIIELTSSVKDFASDVQETASVLTSTDFKDSFSSSASSSFSEHYASTSTIDTVISTSIHSSSVLQNNSNLLDAISAIVSSTSFNDKTSDLIESHVFSSPTNSDIITPSVQMPEGLLTSSSSAILSSESVLANTEISMLISESVVSDLVSSLSTSESVVSNTEDTLIITDSYISESESSVFSSLDSHLLLSSSIASENPIIASSTNLPLESSAFSRYEMSESSELVSSITVPATSATEVLTFSIDSVPSIAMSETSTSSLDLSSIVSSTSNIASALETSSGVITSVESSSSVISSVEVISSTPILTTSLESSVEQSVSSSVNVPLTTVPSGEFSTMPSMETSSISLTPTSTESAGTVTESIVPTPSSSIPLMSSSAMETPPGAINAGPSSDAGTNVAIAVVVILVVTLAIVGGIFYYRRCYHAQRWVPGAVAYKNAWSFDNASYHDDENRLIMPSAR